MDVAEWDELQTNKVCDEIRMATTYSTIRCIELEKQNAELVDDYQKLGIDYDNLEQENDELRAQLAGMTAQRNTIGILRAQLALIINKAQKVIHWGSISTGSEPSSSCYWRSLDELSLVVDSLPKTARLDAEIVED